MNKNFTVKCSMEERWIDCFITMLKTMERYGNIGHSGIIGIYSDGDGDFRPEFNFDIEQKNHFFPYPDWQMNNRSTIYDADYNKTRKEYEHDCRLEYAKNKPQIFSNADWIRSLNNEKLADVLDSLGSCSHCRRYGNDCFPTFDTLKWLNEKHI